MSKSILGLIVALFFALQLRAEQPIFNISSIADVTPGQIIDIDFHVDNFNNLVGAQFSVNWNPGVLDFRAVKNLNPSVTGLSPSSFNVVDFIDEGKFTMVWFESSVTPITIPNGSLFFTVEFEVVGDPCQSSLVAITGDPTEIEVTEDGVNQIGLVTHNGQVSVQGTGCVEDINIIGNSVAGACGSTTCIRFTVENFITVGAMDFSILYNPAVLQFNHFQNFAPLLSFGDGNTNLFAPGTLRVVWYNSNTVNDTLPDGTTLFEVCFDVIGTGGQSSEIAFGPGNDPDGLIFDIDGNVHNVSVQSAQITAQCQLEGFAFIADTVCTTPDGVTCIDIKVNDFVDIITFELSMNWDSTKFKFDHVEELGLLGLVFPDDFGTPANIDVDEGELTVLWIDLSLNGFTVPDFSTIFRLCLKAVGPVGSSSAITFSDTPIDIEVATLDSVLEFGLLHGLAEIKQTCDTVGCTISYTIAGTSPACPREPTGAVDLNVTLSNCTDKATFLWSYNNITTEDLTGVPAGTYTVTITAGNVVIANAVVSDPPPLSVNGIIIHPNPAGSPTGSINITVTGGTPPYTFLWSYNSSMTEDLDSIPPGTYSVTVTDSKGCTFIPDSYIVGADVVAAVTPVSCAGGSNGAINLSVSFGTPPYSYLWNTVPASITKDINNLKAGTYCVTITDSNSSTRDTCFTITQPPSLVVTATITHDVNENCNGAIDLNVTGGTLPYTYLWSNNAVTQDIINLCAGQYCVTITHNGGACTFDTCFTVLAGGISVNLVALQYGNFQTSCNGICDGEITSVVTGGSEPFMYQWSNGPTTPDLINLCQGVYSLTVTDAAGQTATATRTITSPPALNLTVITTDPTDFSSSDGAASVVVNGGVPNYTYQWTGPIQGNTAALNNLPAGNYQITVKDANQCEITREVPLFPDIGDCYKGIPVITPNSDGKNDYFIITCIFDGDNHLSIYNRYGGLVYETDNYTNNWTGVDGDNQPLPDGGYLWVLELTNTGGNIQILKGTVNLLRTAD